MIENLPLFQTNDATIPDKYAGLSVFSVSGLRDRFNRIVKDAFKAPILLSGIISSEPKKYPSFVFFDIKDEKDNVSFTVMGYIGAFYNIEKKLKEIGAVDRLTTDVPVMLVVEPGVSREKNIQIRLSLVDIVAEYTKSKFLSARDETVQRLQKEKFLDNQKSLHLPTLITRIGLLTSDQGTSVKDITSAMGRSLKHLDIIFKPVRVEGNSAVTNIIEGIEQFNKFKKTLNVDLLIIARGGGSTADLAPFDNYDLCRAVCLSKIPIITAIGHDKDIHAIELCSHITPVPSTPSGIGAFIKNYFAEMEDDLLVTTENLSKDIFRKFSDGTQRLLSAVNILNNRIWGIRQVKAQKVHMIKSFLNLMQQGIPRLFKNRENEVKNLDRIISAYDHKAILKRGYSVIIDNGKIIKSKNDMPQTASIEFIDGLVNVRRID